eukprot:TRINITY_DN3812_c0_g1_i4.p3 TRINITY_DN3812_c0_g1~~TRINITY_DN3812_c0_g1_i4.p3  ORF type:complete len:104 (-),score=23.27 TRINITY_DN3812_c0_g1_i4:208-519(-)
MQEIDKYAQENVNKLLIANKTDLADRRKVSIEEGQKLAELYNIPFLEVSAKSGTNIEESFTKLGDIILKNSSLIKSNQQPFPQTKPLAAAQNQKKEKAQDGCC